MAHNPAYCFVCGQALRMCYPGGDPENGPATPRCRDGHPTVEEFAEEYAMENLDELNEAVEEDRKLLRQYDAMPVFDVHAALGIRNKD